MNRSIIKYVLGHVLMTEALLMLLPCAVALFYGEKVGVYYLAVAAAALGIGALATRKKPKNTVFYLKEAVHSTKLDSPQLLRLSAFLAQRRDTQVHRCTVRDCLGLYNNGSQHPFGC